MSKLMVRGEPNWALLLEEWERSGLSQKKFCEQQGVSYFNFCKRRSRMQAQDRKHTKVHSVQAAQEVGFIPVTVEMENSTPQPFRLSTQEGPNAPSAPGNASAEVEVELPFGVVLRFRGVAAR